MTPGIFIKYANSCSSFTCVCACVFEGGLDEDRCFSLHTAGNCLQVREEVNLMYPKEPCGFGFQDPLSV